MGSPFHEPAYPQLNAQDFGTASQHRVAVHNGGRTVAVGDWTDGAIQTVHTLIHPGPDAVDVVIHGLPGRFIDKLAGNREIPAAVVADLLESAGVIRGTPLRLLTCHAAELPLRGETAGQGLATEWRGPVSGPNGLLVIGVGQLRVDLVDWDPDPILGGMMPSVVGRGLGTWVISVP